MTWYGSRALPWHFPHSSDPLDPAWDHTADNDSRRAAPAELPSGASFSTSSTVHRVPPSAATSIPPSRHPLPPVGPTPTSHGTAGV